MSVISNARDIVVFHFGRHMLHFSGGVYRSDEVRYRILGRMEKIEYGSLLLL